MSIPSYYILRNLDDSSTKIVRDLSEDDHDGLRVGYLEIHGPFSSWRDAYQSFRRECARMEW